MKHWICSALLFAACGGLQAAEKTGGNADIAQFIKDNGRFVSRLSADVTGDGVADTIVVTADDKRFENKVTVMMQPRRRPGTVEELEAVDSLQLELTPLGPPTVKVVKGVLIIENLAGGSTVRTAATYRYRFDAEEGRMRLIGLDAERTSSTSVVKFSWNALNGARIVRNGMREGENIRYGPESKTTYKPGAVYMSLTPTPDELIDAALGAKPKGK